MKPKLTWVQIALDTWVARVGVQVLTVAKSYAGRYYEVDSKNGHMWASVEEAQLEAERAFKERLELQIRYAEKWLAVLKETV